MDNSTLTTQAITIIQSHPDGIHAANLARCLGLPRSNVERLLAAMEANGILLAETDGGLLTMYEETENV